MSKRNRETKLEKLGFEKADISVRDLKKAVRDGSRYIEEGQWEKALPPLLAAWEAMPDDIHILTYIAQALSRLGVREQALAVLERALTVHEPSEDICTIMLILAIEMELWDIAINIGLQLITMNPAVSRYYVNLATAYMGANKLDEGVAILQEVLPLFPNDSDLWNVLALLVRERDGVDAADVFFEEALRLKPDNLKVISNYAISFGRRHQFEKALELNLKAIELAPESPESRVGAGQLHFHLGQMQEAWEHYEYRLNTRRKKNQTQIYTHGIDTWEGQSLEGKTLLIAAEQGIGDEVMFGNYLPFLYDKADKLVIGCEPRLVSLYKRRFPNAFVDRLTDHFDQGYRYRYFLEAQKAMKEDLLKVDYAIPLASAPKFDWTNTDNIRSHSEPLLCPDADLKKKFAEKLTTISDKPKVGLAWRSGLTSGARRGNYATIDDLGPIMELSRYVDFVNLQYGDCSAELAEIRQKYGVTVHEMEGVDLRQDIEANVAIMSNCDLVVGAATAPSMFAMSAGVPTIVMSAAIPWWRFGKREKVLFVKDCRLVHSEDRHWPDIISEAVAAIRVALKL